jgi:hypothetical protein
VGHWDVSRVDGRIVVVVSGVVMVGWIVVLRIPDNGRTVRDHFSHLLTIV